MVQPVLPPNPAHRRWAIPLAALGLLTLSTVAGAGVVPSSTFAGKDVGNAEQGIPAHRESTPFARVPASAESVGRRVSFGDLPDSAEQFQPRNDFYFVTVSEPPQTALSWFVGRDEEAVDFITEIEKYGRSSPSERRQVSQQMMATSEQVAQYVALDKAGYDVELVPGEVVVGQLLCLEGTAQTCTTPAPADEVIDQGDVLLQADGDRLDTLDDLASAIADRQPGDVIDVELRRGGSTKQVQVELTGDPDEPDRTLVGFVPVDTARVELPFEVDIDTGAIGGPSAGLAFTLSLLDRLTPGDLTPAEDVAVTGTIGLEGNVGAIGGLPQKVEAVKQHGVDVFLVPASQTDLEEAREVAGDDLELVPVATLDEALAELQRLGGDPLG